MNILRSTFSSDETCLLDVEADSIEAAFEHTLQHLVDKRLIAPAARGEVLEALMEREKIVSTAIGHALAVPHCYVDTLTHPLVVFVRLKDALNLGAPDRIATRFLFILLGPKSATAGHLDTLASVARLMSDVEFRYDLAEADSHTALAYALERSVARSAEASAPEADTAIAEGLEYTGKLGGGLLGDIRRRLPQYVSDFRDGLHAKSIASILFLFFACLAPAVTFGGVMSIATGDQIGAVEMITATAICGVIYAVLAGQPLIILGGTGPLLVFTAILYRMCGDLDLPFLPTYAWVGLWTAIFTILLALTDASSLMRFFTRFTDEIFAALISLIFIYEAIRSLVVIFHDLDVKQHHDTALLSLLLALGTFYLATSLQSFRNGRYLIPWMREFLADFGPTIALLAMTLIAFSLHEVYLDVLPAPDSFGTTSGRAWWVNPLDAPTWARFAAMGPALLATILVYLDQNITARLVNSADHKLSKGSAYHLDLAVVGGLIGFCTLFGLPWLVAATVRSLNHVRSLATVEEVVAAPGERHDRIIHVRENRVTPLVIHVLIGVSLLALPLLKSVPMAVLYGLFLFMGVVSMRGNQFFERLSLWAMDSALYPATHYMRRVPAWTIHKFTAIQLAGLVVLWAVKTSRLAILFPLFIALLVPVRYVMSKFFREVHLQALDAEELPEEEEQAWS